MVKDPYTKVVTPETEPERACPKCGHFVKAFATDCPQCGYTMVKRSYVTYYVIAILLLVIAILAYYVLYMT